MAVELRVPVGGEGAETYLLVRWYAAEGDRVNEGDALFEIETAKATYDVSAPADGVLTITVAEGAEVSAHQVVGVIGDAVVALQEAPAEPEPEQPRTTPSQPASSQPAEPQHAESEPAKFGRTQAARVAASPRARTAARDSDADLTAVNGTGPGGRVLARDVPAAPLATGPTSIGQRTGPDRSVIARRMNEAAAIPTVTLHRWCDGTVLADTVTRLRAEGDRWGLARVGVGDVLAVVVARLLRRHPDLNAHWVDGVRRHESVHLGVAVDAPWGLVVPVVRDAHLLSVGQLSTSLADLAARARERTVARSEITGSTFTITNLGPTGVEHFTPLLNPPEVAILGVGALVPAHPRVNADDDVPVRLPLSLTFDHRALDGAPAGRFLADVAAGVEAADVMLALGDSPPGEGGGRV